MVKLNKGSLYKYIKSLINWKQRLMKTDGEQKNKPGLSSRRNVYIRVQ